MSSCSARLARSGVVRGIYDLDHEWVVGSKDGKGGAGVNSGGDDECVWRDWGLDRCREWGARWVLVEAMEISVEMVKGPDILSVDREIGVERKAEHDDDDEYRKGKERVRKGKERKQPP